MNRKILALVVLIVSMLSAAPLANAQPLQALTVWTDKAQYAPGDTGTMYFALYNNRDSALTIKKVMITFMNWRAYRDGQWEGNLTLELNQPVGAKGILENNTKFTVPSDGRAEATIAFVEVETAEAVSPIEAECTILVYQTPTYMENIVNLFTILVVLVIVCTVIIAATIFLSTRRPQVTWKTEEKQP